MKDEWYVQIISKETQLAVRTMGPMSYKKGMRVAGGTQINLDHDRYYVLLNDDNHVVESEPEAQP